MNPDAAFIRKVKLAESAFAGFSFANAWVSCPAASGNAPAGELPPLPVSGHAREARLALRYLMMEAVERHSSIFVGSEAFCVARASELPRAEMTSLLHFSSSQYAARKDAIPVDDPRWVPQPVGDAALRWVEAHSLLSGAACYVPAGVVYLGYGMPDEPLYYAATSNGCAAGETKIDAAFRALLEVVERDALAIWWYNRIRRPGFDFQDDEELVRIQEALGGVGRSLELVDLTHDLGIPVVGAFSAEASGERIYLGCAADLCCRRAARRAAAEMLQFWFWGEASVDAPGRVAWLENESLASQAWLKPSACGMMGDLVEKTSPLEGLKRVVQRMAASRVEPLVVDLTRESTGIPVVRVLAPGLRGVGMQFGAGRLYHVPKRLGWLAEERKEAELMQYVCPI